MATTIRGQATLNHRGGTRARKSQKLIMLLLLKVCGIMWGKIASRLYMYIYIFFFFLSAQRAVMPMMIIPLPHYDNFWNKFLSRKKKMCRSRTPPPPPPISFYRTCATFEAGGGRCDAFCLPPPPPPPPLSKHHGAAPGCRLIFFIYNAVIKWYFKINNIEKMLLKKARMFFIITLSSTDISCFSTLLCRHFSIFSSLVERKCCNCNSYFHLEKTKRQNANTH